MKRQLDEWPSPFWQIGSRWKSCKEKEVMINKARVRRLVTALRSGKYKRGKGQLRDDDKFCCLGVACDISGVGEWQGDAYVVKKWGAGFATLPGPVAKYFGFNENDPFMTV